MKLSNEVKSSALMIAFLLQLGCAGMPGNGGGHGEAGATGAGGNASACGPDAIHCMAIPTCESGDQPVSTKDDCLADARCYSVSLCCSTVWCIPKDEASCNDIPFCDDGDLEVNGNCPLGAACYTRELCGTSITCSHLVDACHPASEFHRKYVGTSPKNCTMIKFACPQGTNMFQNDCGCGCEQPLLCPQYVDCMPGGRTLPSLCSNTDECPYTTRAF